MRYFEDLEIDQEVVFEDEYLVTEAEIIEVGKRWDPLPFHTDPVKAKESFFGGLVASSAHIFSIWVRIGRTPEDNDKHKESVSALGFNNLQWHSTVRPNDILKSKNVVLDMRESKSKPNLGVVVTKGTVFNQNNETVFTVECSLLVVKRESI